MIDSTPSLGCAEKEQDCYSIHLVVKGPKNPSPYSVRMLLTSHVVDSLETSDKKSAEEIISCELFYAFKKLLKKLK